MSIFSGKGNQIQSGSHLCKSCRWSQFMAGHRDSERIAVCTNTSPNMVVPFAMLECSGFRERGTPEFRQARASIDLGGRRRSGGDSGGSATALRPGRRQADEEPDEIGPPLQVLFN